jgi:hypothetical protein
MMTDSTANSEMLAVHIAVQETLGVRNLLESIGIYISGPTVVWCDNETAVEIFNDRASSNRTKHLDIRIHMVKEAIKNKLIEVKWRPTDEMTADVLTKGLGRNLHDQHVKGLGMTEIDLSDLTTASVKGSVKNNREVTKAASTNQDGTTEEGSLDKGLTEGKQLIGVKDLISLVDGKVVPDWFKPILEKNQVYSDSR